MKDRATGEYRCKYCDTWTNEPGICERCKAEIDMKVEEFLQEHSQKTGRIIIMTTHKAKGESQH